MLTKLISVTRPFAKAIKCLESSHSTPGDIFLFWTAVTASVKQVLEEPGSGFTQADCDSIRGIVNFRYKQLIDEGPSDVYISCFYLDPRKSCIPATISIN